MKLPFGFEIKLSRRNTSDINPASVPLLRRLINFGYMSRELPTETDFGAQLACYKSWVYVASSMNATSVAQVPIRLYAAKPGASSKSRFPTKKLEPEQKDKLLSQEYVRKLPQVRRAADIEEIVDHPMLDLLRNVNSFNNAFDLWEVTQLHQELAGNAYWLLSKNKLGVPQEIWIIPPDRVKIVPDPTKFIIGYAYEYGMQKYEFSEDTIVHFKMPNPRSLYYGTSPLLAIAEQYGISVNMNKFEQAMFKNMGRLTGAFETADSLDQEDFERLKVELQGAYAGVDNVGKAPLLDKGLTFKNYGMTPVEMSFIEGRKLTQEEIFWAFGQTMGLYTATATRANAEAAQVQYARRALKPRCIRNAEKLNEKVSPLYSEYIFVACDDPVPEDRLVAMKERSENIRVGLTTINEERRKVRMPPIEGGDEPLIQAQYLPLSAVIAGANQVQAPVDTTSPSKPSEEDAPKPPKKGNGAFYEEYLQ